MSVPKLVPLDMQSQSVGRDSYTVHIQLPVCRLRFNSYKYFVETGEGLMVASLHGSRLFGHAQPTEYWPKFKPTREHEKVMSNWVSLNDVSQSDG